MHTPTPDHSLATAVNALTRTHVVEHRIRMVGGGRRVHQENRPPLIVLLRTGGMPSTESNASAANARSMVDADSIQKLAQLREDIRILWKNLLPGAVAAGILGNRRVPENTLAVWHSMFIVYRKAGMVPLNHVTYAERICTGWVKTIEAKFDPPQVKENTDPCPECGVRRLRIGEGVDEREVFAITYQLGNGVASIMAHCGGCGATWVGEQELRDLGNAQRAYLSLFG